MNLRILVLLFLPTVIFSQQFERIHTISLDTFERAIIWYGGNDFVLYGGENKPSRIHTHVSSLDGTIIQEAKISRGGTSQQREFGETLVNFKTKKGYLNPQGAIIVPMEFDMLPLNLKDGYALGKKEDKWFLINHLGEIQPFPNPNNYKKLELVGENIIIGTNENNLQQLVDFKGNPIFESQYSRIIKSRYRNDIFRVSHGNKAYSVLSAKDSLIIDRKSNCVVKILEDQIEVEYLRESYTEIYDIKGNPIYPNGKKIYKVADDFGYIFLEERGDQRFYGVLNKEMEVILPAKYTFGTYSREGFFKLDLPNSRCVVVDMKGDSVITESMDIGKYAVRIISNDDIILKKKRASFWHDGKGKQLLSKPFLEVAKENPYYGMKRGKESREILAVLKKDSDGNSGYRLYNRADQRLNEEVYDSIFYYTPNLLMHIKNGKMGLLNNQGKIILPIEYDQISPIYKKGSKEGGIIEPYLRIFKGEKSGLIDLFGKIVLPLSQDISDVIIAKDQYVWLTRGQDIEVYELRK